MTTSYPPFGSAPFGTSSSDTSHPSLDWAVTPDQRARAEDWLQRAYTEGRLTHEEFDRRMGIALEASTRRELNAAFDGIATIPTGFPGGAQPSASAFGNPHGSSYGASQGSAYGMSTYRGGALSRTGGTGMGALAHLSGGFVPLVGPGIFAALTPAGGPAHREAAKAFNASLSMVVLTTVFGILQHIVHPLVFVTGLLPVLWFVFSVIGAVKANQGEQWTNPFSRVLPLRVISER